MADQQKHEDERLPKDDESASDKTVAVSAETDNEQQQMNGVVSGGDRPTQTNDGIGLPTVGDEETLRFVPERTRIMSRMDDETDEWAEREEMMAQADQMLMLNDTRHKDALLLRLDTFRRNRAFCDVVLFVDGHELLAHKAVLAAISSPLFDLFHSNTDTIPIDEENEHTLLPDQALELAKAMSQVATANANRNNQMPQQQQPQQMPAQNGDNLVVSSTSTSSTGGGDRRTAGQMAYFEFSETDFDSMEALVEFAYTARLRIGSRHVNELYRTAFALKVTSVAQACAHWLAEHLTVSNCIGIRRQANLNEDFFLLSRVDTFICANFEAVASESSEFAQLPCIQTQIIVSDGGREFASAESDHHSQLKAPLLPSGNELALHCLRYFQHGALRAAGERVDAHIATLTERKHLLVANAAEEHQQQQMNNGGGNSAKTTTNNGKGNGHLQDANELDEKTLLGSCDLVKDYKRSTSIVASGKKSLTSSKTDQLSPLHVTGATPIKLNGSGTGRLVNNEGNKFASRESLCSLGSCCSNESAPSEGIAANGGSLSGANLAGCRQIICVLPTAPGYWVCLALLFHRLVRISIHLSDDVDLIRSSRTSSVASSTDGLSVDSEGSVVSTEDIYISNDGTFVDPNFRSQHSLLPVLKEARCAFGAAFLDGKILISGGFDRNLCLSSSEELNICGGVKEWQSLAPMCSERARFDGAVVDGKVFAVCGSNGNNDLSTCECFDPSTGQWAEMRPLERARSHNGCASLDGLLYCIGGATDCSTMTDCARYDPKTNEWSEIAPLKAQRSQAGCTSWRGLVVCVGGNDGWNCLSLVEAYDPQMNQWRHLARLRTPRRGCSVAVLGNSLFAIGGHDGHNALTSVEVLDSTNAQWRLGPSLQQSARVHHHAISAPGMGIFVVGGFDGAQFLASMEVMESEEIGWHSWLENEPLKQGGASPLTLTDGDNRRKTADDEPETESTTPTPRG